MKKICLLAVSNILLSRLCERLQAIIKIAKTASKNNAPKNVKTIAKKAMFASIINADTLLAG